METYQGVALKIEGALLTAEQIAIAVPFLNAYHEGSIPRAKFVAMTKAACRKAGCPIKVDAAYAAKNS